ncbi:MAG: GNAT family N-acetyltransferase [bacterium]|jgi:predicted acetyltransferase
MTLELKKITLDMEQAYLSFVQEWTDNGEAIIPFSARLNGKGYKEYAEETIKMETDPPSGLVKATTLFLTCADEIIGAINIRHTLNEYLLNYGGHIGYGIKPSKRGHGYAKTMVQMIYPLLKELRLDRVLIICAADNIASAKTIEGCGGEFEKEVMDENNKAIRRYWLNVR